MRMIREVLRLKLECAEGRLHADQPVKVSVAAAHLFGDPAAGLEVRCRAVFKAEDLPDEGWPGAEQLTTTDDEFAYCSPTVGVHGVCGQV